MNNRNTQITVALYDFAMDDQIVDAIDLNTILYFCYPISKKKEIFLA